MTDKTLDLTYDPHKAIDLENRQRRLLFRSWHRGIKELDLIFGNFVEANGNSFDEADCEWFERLYEEQDHAILAWITSGEDVPEAFQCPMMDRLQKLDFMVLKAK